MSAFDRMVLEMILTNEQMVNIVLSFAFLLISAMVDSLGGPCRVNNVLATLDLPIINNRNLKKMEDMSGDHIMAFSKEYFIGFESRI